MRRPIGFPWTWLQLIQSSQQSSQNVATSRLNSQSLVDELQPSRLARARAAHTAALEVFASGGNAVDAAVGRVKLGGPNGPLPPKLSSLVSNFLRVDPTIRPPRCFNITRPTTNLPVHVHPGATVTDMCSRPEFDLMRLRLCANQVPDVVSVAASARCRGRSRRVT